MKALVVGVRGIGAGHAKALAGLNGYELAGVVDLDLARAKEVADELGTRAFGDWAKALGDVHPEVVVIATNNVTHARLTLQAVAAGVKGVYCEKPMAVHWSDALEMAAACREKGVVLIVNHQRRMLPVLRKMRALIAEGAIGEVSLIRSINAGDILSDGTHAIDSVRFLAGDGDVKTVYGAIWREDYASAEPMPGFDAANGTRYGHPVEDAGFASLMFESGLRAEVLTGQLMMAGRVYQDYEVFGSKGRIWKRTDNMEPQLQMENGSGWQEISSEPPDHNEKWRLFGQAIREGIEHPLDVRHGLKDMEIVSAIYESARLRRPVHLPLAPTSFPLEVMLKR